MAFIMFYLNLAILYVVKRTPMFHLCPFLCTNFPQAGKTNWRAPPSIGEEKSPPPNPVSLGQTADFFEPGTLLFS